MWDELDYTKINPKATKVFEYLNSELQKAGYGVYQRAAILGNIQRESSGNPLAISSNGLWHGLIQWDSDRYRIGSNDRNAELKRQTAVLLNELEKKGWSGRTWRDQVANSDAFKQADSLERAVEIFTRRFARPANVDSEIQKRLEYAKLGMVPIPEDPEYDTKAAIRELPPELIDAWRQDPEKNHLPSGYTDEKGDWHGLKSVYHPSWGEKVKWQQDPKNLEEMLHYSYPENHVSKFLVYKGFYANGGSLVYNMFDASTSPSTELPDETPPLVFEKMDSFPVESVSAWDVDDFSRNWHYTVPEQKDRGAVELKQQNMDLGNMKELIDLMAEEGISFRVTSVSRPGARTSTGKVSHHAHGNAMDITPLAGQSWDELLSKIYGSPRVCAYLREHRWGILDERSKEMQRRTGATGAHLHIGPDGKMI